MKRTPEQHAQEILRSIHERGLTAPQESSIRGSLKDDQESEKFCYNQVDLDRVSNPSEAFDALAYHEKEGMISIAMERHYNDDYQEQLSRASLNSVVFVFEIDRLRSRYDNETPWCLDCDGNTLVQSTSAKEGRTYFQEIRLLDAGISRNKIKAILTPYHLLPLVRSTFTELTVIPMNMLTKTLTQDPLELFSRCKTARGQDVLSPNYIAGLRHFVSEFPDLKQFGVHATRLPMDLPVNLSKDTYNGVYKRFRLKNLSEEKRAALEHDNKIIVLRSGQETIAYCPPELKLYLFNVAEKFEVTSKAATSIQRYVRHHIVSKNKSRFFRTQLQKLHQLKDDMRRTIDTNDFATTQDLAKQADNLTADIERSDYIKGLSTL